MLLMEHLLPAFTVEYFGRGLQIRKWITGRSGNFLKVARRFAAGVVGVKTGFWSQTA